MTLAPIPDLEFFGDPLHRYRYRGNWLAHSVTEVISDLTPFARAKIEATKDVWLPRGNTVHQALETFLLTGERTESEDYASIIDPLLDHALWKDCEVLACEYRLCDAQKSLGGSVDFILRTSRGKTVIGDLKTVGSTPAVSSRKPATKQLGAYLAMTIDHHPRFLVDSCVTVVAGPALTRVQSQTPDECLMAWVDAWDAFNFLQPNF